MMGLRLRMPLMQHAAEKGWYFAFFASLSFVVPYMNLYYRRQGYSEDVIGFLAGLKPWVYASSGPLWAAFADKTRKHRIVMISTLAISTICRSLIGTTGALELLIPLVVLAEIFGSPVTAISDAAILALCAKDGSYGKQRLWGAIGWGISSVISGVLVTKFGLFIVFFAYSLMSILALAFACKLNMTGLTSSEPEAQKTGPHATKAGSREAELTEVATITVDFQNETEHSACEKATKSDIKSSELVQTEETEVPRGTITEDNESFDEENVPLISAKCEDGLVGKTLDVSGNQTERMAGKLTSMLTKEVYIFLLMAFFMGVGSGTIENFLFLYLDELGAPEVLMGLSLMVTCAAEVPFFFFMDKILKTFGTLGTLHMVLLVFSFRLLCYPMLVWCGSPWWVLLVEPMHSVTFACAWGAGTEHSRRIAPPGLDATLQSVFAALYFGFGYGSGAIVGGLLYNNFGARVMFASVSGVLAMAWIFCLLMTWGLGKNGEQRTQQQ